MTTLSNIKVEKKRITKHGKRYKRVVIPDGFERCGKNERELMTWGTRKWWLNGISDAERVHAMSPIYIRAKRAELKDGTRVTTTKGNVDIPLGFRVATPVDLLLANDEDVFATGTSRIYWFSKSFITQTQVSRATVPYSNPVIIVRDRKD